MDGNNDCSEDAQCFDTPELFGCTCNEGFDGDGKICTGQLVKTSMSNMQTDTYPF